MRNMIAFAIAAIASVLSAPLPAQWLHLPTPGIPRTANGKANLAAPASRTADGKPNLSGIWQRTVAKYNSNIAADLKPSEVQPSAEALVKSRMANFGREYMGLQCLPYGPNAINSARRAKIIQTPTEILMLDEDLTYRQIFMDGRKLESEPNPSWMGYSVAHWDGDALVVESNGYNDRTWLDRNGHPHSEALRMTERYRRPDFGHLQIEVTLTDPAIYARPLTLALNADLVPDTELLESVCNEGNTGREHWVGELSDAEKNRKKLSPELLAKYAGTYEEQDLWGQGPHPRMIDITVVNGELVAQLKGRDNVQLVAQSDTTFTGFYGLGLDFVRDANGVVTHVLEMHVSGNYRFRKR
jgi:hypothetical protein